MEIDHVLTEIVNKGKGKSFYSFSNADGKRWLMAARNMRTAMSLYQPSGVKGRLMKSLFPYLYRLDAVCKVVHAERRNYVLHEKLEKLLCRVFDTDEIEFSIFCGTPCIHQKITMQVSKGDRILGYCKFSDNEEIISIFGREKDTLDYLWKQGVETVPRCLYCGKMGNGIGLFVQATTKSIHSDTDHLWGEREEDFLKKLHDRTKCRLPFEQTDFYQDICFLQDNLGVFTDFETVSIHQGVEQVMNRLQGQEVEFSFLHADFTPWNMYVERGKLFVFDLEYAKRSYPPYLDYFHFLTQTAIFERHLSVDEIWRLYQQGKQDISTLFKDVDFAYLCYLLGVISHYLKRENGRFDGDMLENMKLRMELITCICNAGKS